MGPDCTCSVIHGHDTVGSLTAVATRSLAEGGAESHPGLQPGGDFHAAPLLSSSVSCRALTWAGCQRASECGGHAHPGHWPLPGNARVCRWFSPWLCALHPAPSWLGREGFVEERELARGAACPGPVGSQKPRLAKNSLLICLQEAL